MNQCSLCCVGGCLENSYELSIVDSVVFVFGKILEVSGTYFGLFDECLALSGQFNPLS